MSLGGRLSKSGRNGITALIAAIATKTATIAKDFCDDADEARRAGRWRGGAIGGGAEGGLSREQLLEQVWGYDYHGDLRVVDAVVKRLRAKLRQAAPVAEVIVTVRGVGYRLLE